MFYILDNKTPVKFDTDTVADMVKWAEFQQNIKLRRVASTQVNESLYVSTVFLGISTYGYDSDGRPYLFETIVFRNGEDDLVRRACSWEEAETVHKEVLARVTTHSVSG